MAHGHLIPCLTLANQILHRAATPISIVVATTNLNIYYLHSSRSTDSADILFAELPFRSTDHGLPLDTKNADSTDAWSRFFQMQISMSMESHAWLCRPDPPPLGLTELIISQEQKQKKNSLLSNSGREHSKYTMMRGHTL